jgi:hypothetical protein
MRGGKIGQQSGVENAQLSSLRVVENSRLFSERQEHVCPSSTVLFVYFSSTYLRDTGATFPSLRTVTNNTGGELYQTQGTSTSCTRHRFQLCRRGFWVNSTVYFTAVKFAESEIYWRIEMDRGNVHVVIKD